MSHKLCRCAVLNRAAQWLVSGWTLLYHLHLGQLFLALCDDVCDASFLPANSSGIISSRLCLTPTQPHSHNCLSQKATSVLPWNICIFFSPLWTKLNLRVSFCLAASRTAKSWLESLHDSCPSSPPQPLIVTQQRKRSSLVATPFNLAVLTHTDFYYNIDWFF